MHVKITFQAPTLFTLNMYGNKTLWASSLSHDLYFSGVLVWSLNGIWNPEYFLLSENTVLLKFYGNYNQTDLLSLNWSYGSCKTLSTILLIFTNIISKWSIEVYHWRKRTIVVPITKKSDTIHSTQVTTGSMVCKNKPDSSTNSLKIFTW